MTKLTPDATKALITRATKTLKILDNIDSTFNETRQDPSSIEAITKLFSTELSSAWLALAARLSSRDSWRDIEGVVEEADVFIERMRKAVLAPKRVEFEVRMHHWLRAWSLKPTAVEPFLIGATNEDIS